MIPSVSRLENGTFSSLGKREKRGSIHEVREIVKLLRYGEMGAERPGLLDAGGNIRDLSKYVEDIGGDSLLPSSLEMLSSIEPRILPVIDERVRLGPCVARPGKFICIGLNYSDHAAEAKIDLPPEPIVFMKATSAIVGPEDDLILPRHSCKTDWELELGVIIGRKAKYIDVTEAGEYVAGYCVINDVSERSFQMERSGQWTKGKSCDTFGPIGPWLVTKDEVPDPQTLPMWLSVNGQVVQRGTTGTMVCSVSFLVSYLSKFMSLHPGDIIATGTPAGVGMGMRPERYLAPGDIVELSIEGLGRQRHLVRSE